MASSVYGTVRYARAAVPRATRGVACHHACTSRVHTHPHPSPTHHRLCCTPPGYTPTPGHQVTSTSPTDRTRRLGVLEIPYQDFLPGTYQKSVILHCLPIQIGWYAGTRVRYQTVPSRCSRPNDLGDDDDDDDDDASRDTRVTDTPLVYEHAVRSTRGTRSRSTSRTTDDRRPRID